LIQPSPDRKCHRRDFQRKTAKNRHETWPISAVHDALRTLDPDMTFPAVESVIDGNGGTIQSAIRGRFSH
jgi:hypothetical protein